MSHVEITFGMIKPDALAAGHGDAILKHIQSNELRIEQQKTVQLTQAQAEDFYAIHRSKPFFGELVEYMTSGPVKVFTVTGKNAVTKYREVIGATDPNDAAPGTIRKLFGTDKAHNAVHGSDSIENAKIEIAAFFPSSE